MNSPLQRLGIHPAPISKLPIPMERTRELPRGRLIELVSELGPSSGSSLAAFTLREAQQEGGLAAWIESEEGALFPPDLARSGIDLDSLLIVRTPASGGVIAIAKAAEILLRTGAFSALTLDFASLKRPRGEAFLARLAALAREHHAHVLILRSAYDEFSLGTSIALRLDARRSRIARGRFRVELHSLKNKLGEPPPRLVRSFSAPEGIR